MVFPRTVYLVLAASLIAVCSAAENRARPTRPAAKTAEAEAYKGAIIMDAATGAVLHEDRADTITPPASMTKLMTYAIVADRLASGSIRLDTPVRITAADAKMGGTQVFLDPRETFTVEELIYAMMIQSANDAAHALARTAAGSVPAFVELMNAKAQELGMKNTTFRTPHGLPPPSRKVAEGDLTTPRDFAVLSRYLVTRTEVLTYTAIRTRPFGEGSRPEPMAMTNHNHLLGRVAGVDGLKTGFTNGAGFCVASTAQRQGRRVIVVMMGSPAQKVRDLHVTELLERGFSTLPPLPAAPVKAAADSPIMPAPRPASKPAAAPANEEPVIKFSVPKR